MKLFLALSVLAGSSTVVTAADHPIAADHPMWGHEENMDCVCELWGGKFLDGGVNKTLSGFVEHPHDAERFGDSNAEYRVKNCGEFNPHPTPLRKQPPPTPET